MTFSNDFFTERSYIEREEIFKKQSSYFSLGGISLYIQSGGIDKSELYAEPCSHKTPLFLPPSLPKGEYWSRWWIAISTLDPSLLT